MIYVDDILVQYAEAFIGNMEGDGDIAYKNELRSNILNYSTESLHEVDRYLALVHTKRLDNKSIEYQNTVLWCGAYTGEVIKRNAPAGYHWLHYEEYMKNKEQQIKQLIPYLMGTHFMLADTDSTYVTMPVNKVIRAIEEGNENNIHFYAEGDIARKKKGVAPSQNKVISPTANNKPRWKIW